MPCWQLLPPEFSYRDIFCRKMGKNSWEQFVRGMIERGLRGVRLVVGDRCAGLVSTVRSMLPRAGQILVVVATPEV